MEIIVLLIIIAMMSYWCYKIASRNGRDKIWAALWGALFGICAVVVYAILGPTKEVKVQRAKDLLKKD